jgi:beta-lactamase class A
MRSSSSASLALLLATLLTACASSGAHIPPTVPPRVAESRDAVLQRDIEQLVKGFRGDIGVYVHNLRTGATVEIAADDTFPTASMVKVPLLIALFDQAAQGRLQLDSMYTFNDSSVVQADGDDLMAQVRLGSKFTLRKMAYLMTGFSDNTASVWIQSLIGGSQVANAWLESHGYRITRDNSRLAERRPIWRIWGWGMTSPREMSMLLMSIRRGEVVSREASEEMYNLLTHNYWKDDALAGIPPWVQAADKSGSVDASRSEALLVNAPAGDYVVTVATKNITDRSYGIDNEAAVLLRKISWTVYHHFNAGDEWRPTWMR